MTQPIPKNFNRVLIIAGLAFLFSFLWKHITTSQSTKAALTASAVDRQFFRYETYGAGAVAIVMLILLALNTPALLEALWFLIVRIVYLIKDIFKGWKVSKFNIDSTLPVIGKFNFDAKQEDIKDEPGKPSA